jgi:DNA repair exonuclease SbcCD ATPase subunit
MESGTLGAMVEALPRETARLYAAPLADFVKVRDALAAELKAAGRSAEAADIKKLRKPSPAVWAINRAAQADPDAVRRFIEAVDRLKRAHFGEPGGLAKATADQRAALDHLLERARAVLASAGLPPSTAVAARISATLAGAAADPAASTDLRHGRLTQEAPAPGFEALVGAAPSKAPGPMKTVEPGPPRARHVRARAAAGVQAKSRERQAAREHEAARQRETVLQRARDAFNAAESEAREARQRREEAERVATQAREAAERSTRDVEDLKRRLQEAERRARDERHAAEQAAGVVLRAQRAVDRIEARRKEAERGLASTQKHHPPGHEGPGGG